MTELIKAPKKLVVGKSYTLRIPKHNQPTKIYIDNIMANPVETPFDGHSDNSQDLYTYRVWSENLGWKWFVIKHWELCLFNNWNHKK